MSIVTIAARESFKALHDRFPVVIAPDAWRIWLTASTPVESLKQLLVPPADGVMMARQVSDRVNKISHDDAACLTPVD